eukprot:s2557_g10.t1
MQGAALSLHDVREPCWLSRAERWLMRVDATEFVPSGTWSALQRPAPKLSAASPVFVPGASGAAGYGQAKPWQSQAEWGEHDWQPAAEHPYADFSEPIYVDEESFLTPQLLPDSEPELPEPVEAASSRGSPKSTGEAVETGEVDDVPDADPWPSNRSQASQSSAGLGAASRPRAGTLRVQQRQLRWLLDEGPDFGHDWPRGRGVDSPKFSVAGVTLRLVFFPSGTALTSDGQCAVAVLCEEKTKLKFELFLNGRRSGSKVMLGQSFSCDFRVDRTTAAVEVGIEVQSNLSYAGF